MKEYRLDRDAFKMHKAEESGNNYAYWKNKAPEERLLAACYLNSMSFQFSLTDQPRLNRLVFSMRKNK